MQELEESSCNNQSRLDGMRRMFIGRYLPVLIILSLLIPTDLIEWLSGMEVGITVLLILFLLLLAAYVRATASLACR